MTIYTKKQLKMKKITLLLLVLLNTAYGQEADRTTTYFLIRHAEKNLSDSKNPDPELTDAGVARSLKWKKIFNHIDFDAVYSTDFIRTRKTVEPVAQHEQITVSIYNPKNLDYSKFIKQTIGKNVLIVGHSNSIPNFVNQLIGKDVYKEIDEKKYGFLFIVKIIGDQKEVTVLEIE